MDPAEFRIEEGREVCSLTRLLPKHLCDHIIRPCSEPSRSVTSPIVLDPSYMVGHDVVQQMEAHVPVLMMINVSQGDKIHCFGLKRQL